MALSPQRTIKRGKTGWSLTAPKGIDDSAFKTFAKDKKARKKNKAARKARKQNRK
jgi:hypothetical protein